MELKKPEFEIAKFCEGTLTDVTSMSNLVFSHQRDMFFINGLAPEPVYITFSNGDKGPWSVYLVKSENANGAKEYKVFVPDDMYYLERLYWLGTLSQYGLSFEMVYGQLYTMYVLSKQHAGVVNESVLKYIDTIVNTYYVKDDFDLRDFAKELFLIVYYKMVADEHSANGNDVILGAGLRMLGLHRLLLEQYSFVTAGVMDVGMSSDLNKRQAELRGIVLF